MSIDPRFGRLPVGTAARPTTIPAAASRPRASASLVALLATVLSAAAAVSSPLVFAHSQQDMTEPAEGAVLDASPEKVMVRFDHAMRFAWFRVEGPDGAVELLDSPPPHAVREFSARLAAPLPPGEYVVSWRGLASDGHVMNDEFDFVVGDAAASETRELPQQ